jgi:hypothetical protein
MNIAKARVRCRACGARVSRGLSVCPNCGRDPVRFHSRWRTTALSVLCGLLLGLVLAPLAARVPVAGSAVPAASAQPLLAARPTFTPSATPTRPATATATGTTTAVPTLASTATAGKAVAVPTPAAANLNRPTATARPVVEPPRPVSPKDQTEFGGEDTEIFLQWEGNLLEGQQYAVTVRYIGKADETKTVGSWLRETRWRMPASIFRDISLTLRALKWDVSIVDANGNALSAPSESRIFYWR